mgnify:CR=1 FL=1
MVNPSPILLKLETHPHALITGSSGSGKSYALMYLIGNLLQENPDIELYVLDFKYSDDFEFLTGCEHYFKGDECYDGVMEYYDKFSKRRKKRDTGKRMLLSMMNTLAVYFITVEMIREIRLRKLLK